MCRSGMCLVNPAAAQGREWKAPRKCLCGYRARSGEGRVTAPQIPKNSPPTWREVRLRSVWDWDTPDWFPAGADRESQASKCRLCASRAGRTLGSAIPTAHSRPWAAHILQNLWFSARLVPRESLAALPRWEPVQSHTGEDITAFTGTEPPQICVFCWFSLCFAL